MPAVTAGKKRAPAKRGAKSCATAVIKSRTSTRKVNVFADLDDLILKHGGKFIVSNADILSAKW